MHRLISLALVLLALGIFVAPAAARNHDNGDGPLNKKKCEEMGGFWSNNNGEKSCNVIVATEERPDSVGSEPEQVREFWAIVDANLDGGPEAIVFYSTQTQRGNIGARGTRDTYDSFVGGVCDALGPAEFVHPATCALLYQHLFPEE